VAADAATSFDVFLFSIIGCDEPPTLLVSQLEYYFSLGIRPDRTYLVLHSAASLAPHVVHVETIIFEQYPSVRYHRWIGLFHAKKKLEHLQLGLQAVGVKPGDWIVYADADEFHEFQLVQRKLYRGDSSALYNNLPKSNLMALLTLLSRANISAVRGEFVDHFAPSGALERVSHELWPFDQYSVCCHFTRNVVKATPFKIAAWRPDMVNISDGGFHGLHNTDPGTVGKLVLPQGALVHHFKWTHSLTSRTSRRLDAYTKQRFATGVREAERLQAYLAAHNNTVDVSPASEADCWTCTAAGETTAGGRKPGRDRFMPPLYPDEIVQLARPHKTHVPAAS